MQRNFKIYVKYCLVVALPCPAGVLNAVLPWGLDFNPNTHHSFCADSYRFFCVYRHAEKPVGIPTESSYTQNPEILHTHTPHHVSFR